jgi:hypothetical protein
LRAAGCSELAWKALVQGELLESAWREEGEDSRRHLELVYMPPANLILGAEVLLIERDARGGLHLALRLVPSRSIVSPSLAFLPTFTQFPLLQQCWDYKAVLFSNPSPPTVVPESALHGAASLVTLDMPRQHDIFSAIRQTEASVNLTEEVDIFTKQINRLPRP